MDRRLREPTATEVTAANRRFYEQIASVYDEVDSRRGGKTEHAWLDRVLAQAAAGLAAGMGRPTEALEFLDAGAGSGFLAQAASRYFRRITLLDISKPMLERIELPGARRVQGDCCHLPLGSRSVDFVGAFATLHHLHSPDQLFGEAFRVLRPGGLFYCDHDIEQAFVNRFRLPLKLYRALLDHGHDYLHHCPEASAEDYELSEFHGDAGLSSRTLAQQLRERGFEIVEERVHWEGMGAVARVVEVLGLARVLARPGWAPVVRIIARKRAA
jgi:ubiquinone/menaquinone biosynthesis C-methylase UbiE